MRATEVEALAPATLGDVAARFAHRIDQRRTVHVLVAISGVLLVLGALSAVFHQEKSLWIFTLFDVSRGQAIPPLFSGGLLIAAGLLALGAGRGGRVVQICGWVLLSVGVDEAVGLHDTVQAQTGVHGFIWALFVVGATVALGAALPLLGRGSALVALGALLWVGAQTAEIVLGAAPHDAARYAKEVAELSASVVLALALLVVYRRLSDPPSADPRPLREQLVLALPLGRSALVLAGAIAALVALAIVAEVGGVNAHVFRMNNELTWPPFVSTGLFGGAAALSLLVADLGSDERWTRPGGTVLGVVFAVLAVDELFALHEALRRETPGVEDGQLFLLPLVPFAVVGWVVLARRLRGPLLALWTGGAASWVAAVAIDTFHPPFTTAGSIILEDTLELVGTSCFVLALLGAAQRADASRRNPGHV